jgi:hypothetical protein
LKDLNMAAQPSSIASSAPAANDLPPATAASPGSTGNAERYAHIKSWGADLDHRNRPAYPMERKPARLDGAPLPEPEAQVQNVEVLHSIERPGISRIFGSPQPPSGLSGQMRRVAFKYSESDLRHWLLLLAADRVNMVEGIGSDLMHGHVPNIFAEMGGPAEFKYNREAAIKKTVAVAAVATVAVLLLRRSRRRSNRYYVD